MVLTICYGLMMLGISLLIIVVVRVKRRTTEEKLNNQYEF